MSSSPLPDEIPLGSEGGTTPEHIPSPDEPPVEPPAAVPKRAGAGASAKAVAKKASEAVGQQGGAGGQFQLVPSRPKRGGPPTGRGRGRPPKGVRLVPWAAPPAKAPPVADVGIVASSADCDAGASLKRARGAWVEGSDGAGRGGPPRCSCVAEEHSRPWAPEASPWPCPCFCRRPSNIGHDCCATGRARCGIGCGQSGRILPLRATCTPRAHGVPRSCCRAGSVEAQKGHT